MKASLYGANLLSGGKGRSLTCFSAIRNVLKMTTAMMIMIMVCGPLGFVLGALLDTVALDELVTKMELDALNWPARWNACTPDAVMRPS